MLWLITMYKPFSRGSLSIIQINKYLSRAMTTLPNNLPSLVGNKYSLSLLINSQFGHIHITAPK